MYFKTLSGEFQKINESLKGIIDESLSARAIRGSETEENYEFHVKVTVTSGKAAVIVNFTYDENWLEYYIEMVLDTANDTVTLEAVIRNADGTEKSRTTIASRPVTLETETEYSIRLVSKEIETGVYGVYGYLNDIMVVEAEDLASDYQKGMHGLECLGSASQYSTFKDFNFFKIAKTYGTTEGLKRKLGIEVNDFTQQAELISDLQYADSVIDTHFAAIDEAVPSPTPRIIQEIAEILAQSKYLENRNPSESQQLKEQAESMLTEYIDAKYKKGIVLRRGREHFEAT